MVFCSYDSVFALFCWKSKKKKYNTNICKILKPFTRDIYVKFHITSFIGQ